MTIHTHTYIHNTLFLCSRWGIADVSLILFCPADHVPDWQPRNILLGMIEARSNDVENTHTHVSQQVPLISPWKDQCEWHRITRTAGSDCAVRRHNMGNGGDLGGKRKKSRQYKFYSFSFELPFFLMFSSDTRKERETQLAEHVSRRRPLRLFYRVSARLPLFPKTSNRGFSFHRCGELFLLYVTSQTTKSQNGTLPFALPSSRSS